MNIFKKGEGGAGEGEPSSSHLQYSLEKADGTKEWKTLYKKEEGLSGTRYRYMDPLFTALQGKEKVIINKETLTEEEELFLQNLCKDTEGDHGGIKTEIEMIKEEFNLKGYNYLYEINSSDNEQQLFVLEPKQEE